MRSAYLPITEMRCGARRLAGLAAFAAGNPHARLPPTSAAPSASCTRAAASSFPIRGTWAARAICKAWASRPGLDQLRPRAFAGLCPTARNRCDEVLAHYRELADATDIPLNADFENGFADDPDEVAANVTRCIATGVAGLSIEDSPQRRGRPGSTTSTLALARVKAARAAIDKAGGDVVFTARSEGFIRGAARPRRDDPPPQGVRATPAPTASTRRASRPASTSRRR